MDGTLLNDESELTARTKAAILGAVDAGVIFVTATGRPLLGAEMINGLIDRDMPVIIFNGAAVFMWKSQTNIFNKYLDAALAEEVYDVGVTRDIPVILWTGKGLWASRECEATIKYREIYNVDIGIIKSVSELKEEGIYKLLWIDTPANIIRLQTEMTGHFRGRLNCHSSRPIMLEFVGLDAEKGAAMAELGRIYGVDRSEMIALGDGYNDISMLRYAGLGIAMENSPDDVKAACAHVAPSNNDDGAAIAIEKYLLS